MTREHAEGFEQLEELGAEIIEFPTIEIVPPERYDELDISIDKINAYNWLIFTSRNGVKYFFKRFFEKERDIRDLSGIKICTIGTKTAQEVRKYGLKVDLVPDEFRAEGLIETIIHVSSVQKTSPPHPALAHGGTEGVVLPDPLISPPEILKGMRFLLPRAEKAREIFPEKVRELGGEIDVPVAYRTIKPEFRGKRLRRFLREGRITIATFTSAATFHNLREIMGNDAEELLRGVAIAVIGPVTAEAVEKAGLRVDIMPREATIEAMVEEIIHWIREKDKRETKSVSEKLDEPSCS